MTYLRLALALLLIPVLATTAISKDIAASDVERDLKLDIVPHEDPVHEAGTPLRVGLRIRNTSKQTYPVIDVRGVSTQMPGTEPYIWFTAEIDTGDGHWREIERRHEVGMCGMGDWSWHKRVVELVPGQALEIDNLSPITLFLDLQMAGTVRLVAHYGFAKKADVRMPGAEKEWGPMQGVEPYELVSRPFELKVVRPIEIGVKVKGVLKRGKETAIADLFDVELSNAGKAPLEAAKGTWNMSVEWRNGAGALRVTRTPGAAGSPVLDLAPGASIDAVVGSSLKDTAVTLDQRPKKTLMACVWLYIGTGAPRMLRSAWVEIPLE